MLDSTLSTLSIHGRLNIPGQRHVVCSFFSREKVVTMEFIRKYIHVAKLVKPVLTQEASDYISEEYSKLRSHDQFNSESARVCIAPFTTFTDSVPCRSYCLTKQFFMLRIIVTLINEYCFLHTKCVPCVRSTLPPRKIGTLCPRLSR